MFKWVALKITQGDLVTAGCKNVCEVFKTKEQAEIQALNSEIKKRIQELDDFCQKHTDDNRIQPFVAAKNSYENLIAQELPEQENFQSHSGEEGSVIKELLKGSLKDGNLKEEPYPEIFESNLPVFIEQLKMEDKNFKVGYIELKLTDSEYNLLFTE